MPTPKRPTAARSRAQKMKPTRAAVHRSATEWWQHENRKLSGLRLCERCDAVYYDGHWHTAPLLAEALKSGRKKGVKDVCNECRYAIHGPANASAFEGQLTLDGVGDAKFKADVLSAVRAYGRRATRRDPEDRILTIDDRGERVVIFTTENQMAVGLGKAIDSAFKGGTLRISWSEGDLPARVYWKSRYA